ncbi:LPS-induced tumor necrosis factor alpha factor [Penicillium bovifimosum]|uniref:LPS-induced tumor necrosis factor alpha factor n=1 Tax=Penicillium bovifimosum TaxID=126998 RepID=A0A9W9KVV0_9EURO|nr:LPS-induced tumor necrosis factor alpha factor [Penicillium bovifimosum]KAJ5121295.1 LPS-induced tumor necrosis factor alpha factor [Penicillium bovifimosum]
MQNPHAEMYPHNPDAITTDPSHPPATMAPLNTEKQYPHQPEPAPEYEAQIGEKTYPGQQPPPGPQQFYAPQTQPHPSGYATAVPLHAVQSAATPVDCPICGVREMTKVVPVSGGTTHGWAAVLCFCCCLGCIPYLMSSLKDVEHSCGHCGAKLATWHNSGRVQVFQNGPKK